MRTTVRILALVSLIPLAACFSHTEPASRPAPVLLQPTPSTGTIVVQPQP